MSLVRRSYAPWVAFLLALAGPARAADTPSWSVVRGEVKILCPLTVGGGFEAKTPALTGTLSLTGSHPLALAGDLVVDMKTLDTGIGLRDDHMRNEYLEVGKGPGFDKAVLSGLHLGDVDPDSFQGRAPFTGDLALHGVKALVKGQAEVHREGSSLRVEASFPVTLADFGIPKPQYLGVGVRSEVQVKVALVFRTSSTGAAR
jgi:polyisoprenoid-binding protein YceI